MNKMFDRIDVFFDKISAPKYNYIRGAVCLLFNLLAAISAVFLAYMPICDAGKTRSKLILAIDALENTEEQTSFYMIQLISLVAIGACLFTLVALLFKGLFKLKELNKLFVSL